MLSKYMQNDPYPNGIPNNKTGTTLTAAIHIFCAIVGAGVLALPHSLAWLGWIAGPTLIIVFFLVSTLTCRLLVDVYEVNGVEHGRYHDAVKAILGHHYAIGVSTFQLLNIFLINITYSISSAKAMETIANISCGWHGKSEADCFNSTWALTIIFGAVQVVLSQVRNLEEAWWVSAAGTITSLGYSLIALILGCIYASNRLGTVGGIPATSVNKTFGILNALGAIGFSYNFTVILLEIQDTLRQPPKAAASMRPAVYWGITGSFVLYFVISVTGYASLGNSVPGFILEGYPDAPRWVLLVANICILLHMVSAYQVFGQPMFDTIESHVKAWRIRRAQRLTGPGAAEALARVTPKPKTRCSMDMAERHAPALAAAQAAKAANLETPKAEPPHAGAMEAEHSKPSTASSRGLRRLSRASGVDAVADGLRRLSRASAMYHATTGFADESVPHNDDQFLLPFKYRLVVRTIYVVITTVVAIVMPFFSDMAGLVGALTYFPLAVFFPIECWRRVYKPQGLINKFFYFLECVLILVAICATIAAVRNIINNWSTYKIFQ